MHEINIIIIIIIGGGGGGGGGTKDKLLDIFIKIAAVPISADKEVGYI